MKKLARKILIPLLSTLVAALSPACTPDDGGGGTRGRSDTPMTRTVHGRATLYDKDAQPAGCADDGTLVTLDGQFFGVRSEWPAVSALSDGSVAAVWIYLPDASTCDGAPNPPDGHFVIGSGPIAPPVGPPATDFDTDRLMIRGLAIGGDDACTHGGLDLHDVAGAGDDVAIVATGIQVGWKETGGSDLDARMNCSVTMGVQAQPGFYIASFHGILTGGLSLGGDPAQAMGGSARIAISAGGSVGDVGLPSLSANAASAIDADMGFSSVPLAAPAGDEIGFLPAVDVQCGDGNALSPVELDVSVDVGRDNVYLTPLGSFDGYDFAFMTLPCP